MNLKSKLTPTIKMYTEKESNNFFTWHRYLYQARFIICVNIWKMWHYGFKNHVNVVLSIVLKCVLFSSNLYIFICVTCLEILHPRSCTELTVLAQCGQQGAIMTFALTVGVQPDCFNQLLGNFPQAEEYFQIYLKCKCILWY